MRRMFLFSSELGMAWVVLKISHGKPIPPSDEKSTTLFRKWVEICSFYLGAFILPIVGN
jgi:hypothetical protein